MGSDFSSPLVCDSLKDFYDIYEVTTLKWKVRVPVSPKGRVALVGEGDDH
jgi:hypothetical protein